MKNLKKIVATLALTTILATNSFASILVSDLKSTESPCSVKTNWGVMIADLVTNPGAAFGVIVSFGRIVNAKESAPTCTEKVDNGVIIV
jgi:hypothetical protein